LIRKEIVGVWGAGTLPLSVVVVVAALVLRVVTLRATRAEMVATGWPHLLQGRLLLARVAVELV